MTTLIVVVLVVAAASLALNGGYIVHELGWYPHTKDRKTPTERAFPFHSLHETDVRVTHDYQVMDSLATIARMHGHADIYEVKDPYEALESVIARYKEQPNRSRYDDLVNVPNYICNHVKCDDRINGLIDQIHELMHSQAPEVS